MQYENKFVCLFTKGDLILFPSGPLLGEWKNAINRKAKQTNDEG